MTKLNIDRLCVWSGVAAIVLFFLAFIIAGFLPPPSPSLPPLAVAAMYQDHTNGIRIGMLVMMVSGMFMAPFVGIISAQMRRIPGVSQALVYSQLSAGTANAMFFFLPTIIFFTAAFHPERAPDLTAVLNDFAWICAVLPWPPAFMQCVSIAVVALADPSPKPVFPRWLAYVNIWVAICFLPGSLLVFFKSGPFAWNGLFAFWLAGTVFFIWFVAMVVGLFTALRAEAASPSNQAG